jgi:superfamily I DNA and/or RNA helicase
MHECGKKMRQKPVRQMLAETPTLMPSIKPCFLMSPLSVAQYLPVDAAFDLVVFDEASQIPTWDAVGVIARGKQLIVVGDPKQMPPTSFFQKGADEEAEVEDLESILDECLHAGLMSCFLGWHYRSRHESLIAFSNHRYYEGGLHIFPAAALSDRLGVSFVHVPDGVYEASGSRTNRREAEKVADIVMRWMAAPECEGKSIGVVTFSEAQRDLVEDLVDERRAANPDLEARFAEQGDEPFFVKNLENVQGDERDAIVFSVGYAPDANGKFNMVFGPLSNQGGERRLNVAITRAKEKIVVVSSIHGRQIDTDRVSRQGPADLRAFLEYAEKGYRIVLPQSDAENDRFAEEVSATLERAGAKVSRDVGCGGNRVDVAVRDPDDDAKYVMGVMCDGKGYAGERTARDRDSLRDSVMSSLGWNIVHAWVVDWAYDRARSEKKLLEEFEKATKRKEQK